MIQKKILFKKQKFEKFKLTMSYFVPANIPHLVLGCGGGGGGGFDKSSFLEEVWYGC